MNGWSGMRSAIVFWSALSTMTMSACCRSLLLGADSAQAHSSRSRFGIDRAFGITPVHAAAGEAGQLVEAGQVLVDRERFAEALAQRIANVCWMWFGMFVPVFKSVAMS